MPWSSVSCEEEAYTRQEQYTDKGFTASVGLRCAYADRHSLVADFFTNMPAWPFASIGAYPIGASITPMQQSAFDAASGVIGEYESALVTISFSSAAEQTLISESLEPTVEGQVLDHKLFKWSGDGKLLEENEAPVRLVRGLNLVRTLYKVASIPAAVLSAQGCVNNANYTSTLLGLTFASETLQFGGAFPQRTITTSGSQGWDVTLKFRYQKDGWNKFYRAESQQYEQIVVASTGAVFKQFPPISFAGLL